MSKKYRLLKDLPKTKAGAIVEPNPYGIPVHAGQIGNGWPFFYSEGGSMLNEFIPASYITNKDWFEEVVEPERIDGGVFVWTDELVKRFVIDYNKVDKPITGVDPIGQTIKEWKQNRLEEKKEQSRDWEIVSGCAKNGGIHEWYNDNSHGGLSCWQQKCEIHSVRRLSDNTVWTVGELTTNETGYLYKPIKKFIEHDGVMYVQFDEGRGSNDGCLGINALKKLPPKPQPLFENIVKPPLGLMPEYLHKEQRLSEIKAAVQRYLDVNMAIPIGWIAEQYCIENWLKNKSKQSNH